MLACHAVAGARRPTSTQALSLVTPAFISKHTPEKKEAKDKNLFAPHKTYTARSDLAHFSGNACYCFRCDNAVDIQQGLNFTLNFGHAEDVLGIDLGAEIRGRLDLFLV